MLCGKGWRYICLVKNCFTLFSKDEKLADDVSDLFAIVLVS